MEEKAILTTFTDPMMGLSYECEPIFRKLETHFAGQIAFRYVMSLLVRDVRDFMTPDELAMEFSEGVRRYNVRLAKIYESEEALGGMPINMTDLRLFSAECPSSWPLNLAYHAAKLADADKAELFLYRLRYATIAECRPTTRTEELLDVVRETGIDAERFQRHWRDGSAEAALKEDLRLCNRLGVRSLPAYLIQYHGKMALLQSFNYGDFVSVIEEISGGAVRPHTVEPNMGALRELLDRRPLISPIEVREAFDLPDTDEARRLLRPLLETGEIEIKEAYHGWFIRRKAFRPLR